jgi:hypothetical protein
VPSHEIAGGADMKIDCIVHGRSSLRFFHPALAATADAMLHEGSEKPMQEERTHATLKN